MPHRRSICENGATVTLFGNTSGRARARRATEAGERLRAHAYVTCRRTCSFGSGASPESARRRFAGVVRAWLRVLGAVARASSTDLVARKTRRERNEEIFRTGNERLHDVVEGQVSGEGQVPFLCECADEECEGRVEITLSQWEVVASQPNHFIMEPGHLRSEGEKFVGPLGDYEVVRKPD